MTITRRSHLYPYRTQKLSSVVLMILGGQLPGKVGSRWGKYSSLAQSVEHSAVNRVVVGSSPTGGARKKHFVRSAFFNDVCLWQMMSLTLMMFPSEMMSAPPNVSVQTSHHCE